MGTITAPWLPEAERFQNSCSDNNGKIFFISRLLLLRRSFLRHSLALPPSLRQGERVGTATPPHHLTLPRLSLSSSAGWLGLAPPCGSRLKAAPPLPRGSLPRGSLPALCSLSSRGFCPRCDSPCVVDRPAERSQARERERARVGGPWRSGRSAKKNMAADPEDD